MNRSPVFLAGAALFLIAFFLPGGWRDLCYGFGGLIWAFAAYSTAHTQTRYPPRTMRLLAAILLFFGLLTLSFAVLILLRR